ncbi:hypothetical protein IT072_03645 [Leifsonia sp. ZF2019]|uniref:minor capsid protein n=1 Tax=Leifsonia sp. ZF2019 TaxID=2781978 RepID=UPI001CBCF9ED|nr:minor capsid protein [Leifsonia sp. ZF2019]UAJ80152.1 hypothetical protein IT072_03645 [Leifsonia sp. ZF2019]
MSEPLSYPVRLGRGVAQHAADAGLGSFRLTGPPYTDPEVGIRIDGDLPTTFDRCIVLTVLDPTPDGREDLITPIQFRYRLAPGATPSDARNFGWRIRETFEHLELVRFGDVRISFVEYRNALPFGADTVGRPGGTVTFYFRGRRRS